MKIVKSRPFRLRLSAEKEKKLPTVIVGLFSLREKAPTKGTDSLIKTTTELNFHRNVQKTENFMECSA